MSLYNLKERLRYLLSPLGSKEEILNIVGVNNLYDACLFNEITICIKPWELSKPLFLDELGYNKGTRYFIVNKMGELLYSKIATTIKLETNHLNQIIYPESYIESTDSDSRPVLGFLPIERNLFWSINHGEIVFLFFPIPKGEKVIQLLVANRLTQKEKDRVLNKYKAAFEARNKAFKHNEFIVQPASGQILKIYFLPGLVQQNLNRDDVVSNRNTIFAEFREDEVAYIKPPSSGWIVVDKYDKNTKQYIPTELKTISGSIVAEGVNTNMIKKINPFTYYIGNTEHTPIAKKFKPIEEEKCVDVSEKEINFYKILCFTDT